MRIPHLHRRLRVKFISYSVWLTLVFTCLSAPVPRAAAQAQNAPTQARSSTPEPWMNLPAASTGLAVGQKIPPFQLRDQFGHVQDFNSIRGPNGAAIFFNRSADW
jgi:hypothetical protein